MKQWLKSAIYNPKHTKLTDENILQLLLPSFAGIIICMVCLAGMTWAWFSASISTPSQTITAANYEVTVTSVTKKADGKKIEPQDGKYVLEAGTAYTIQLEAKGTAKEHGGYCLIQNDDGTAVFYTQIFKPNESITISLTVTNKGDYTFTGVWGSIPAGVDESQIIKAIENGTLETPPVTDEASDKENNTDAPVQPETENNETVYVVQPGDTLSKIAEKYYTSVAKLGAYNGIENAAKIQVGQEIKIPPADYEVPENPASYAPQTTESQQKKDEAVSSEPESTSSLDTESETTIPPEESSSAEEMKKDSPQDLLSE